MFPLEAIDPRAYSQSWSAAVTFFWDGAGSAAPAVAFFDCSVGAGRVCSTVPAVRSGDCAEGAGWVAFDCSAAVGWLCIWRCASSDDVAVFSEALLIEDVGGCCLESVAVEPVVCPV